MVSSWNVLTIFQWAEILYIAIFGYFSHVLSIFTWPRELIVSICAKLPTDGNSSERLIFCVIGESADVSMHPKWSPVNTLGPRENGRHSADDIFKCILLNENVWITIKNSLKFVSKRPIINIPALVQIMTWRRQGDKPLSGSDNDLAPSRRQAIIWTNVV